MKHAIFLALALSAGSSAAHSQSVAPANCGVNSALALAQVLGRITNVRAELQTKYPAAVVSLLDVKQMCQQAGVVTMGTRGTLGEFIASGTPCIICLKNPEHFTVLLDGTSDVVRLLDDAEASVQVTARRDAEARFTGFALVPVFPADDNTPRLQMPLFDQYLRFSGIGQKVEYRFPLKNVGQSPLAIEVEGTSCGCTAAVLNSPDARTIVLTPGHSSEVVVSYQVETPILVQQTATLKTNDPRRREVYLSIRGQLPPQLTLSPPALYVDQNEGEEPDKSMKVIGPQAIQVARVWSDLPYLQFKVGDKQQEGERVIWPVRIIGFAQAPVGPISGKVFVRFQNGTEMFVPVRGQIAAGK